MRIIVAAVAVAVAVVAAAGAWLVACGDADASALDSVSSPLATADSTAARTCAAS